MKVTVLKQIDDRLTLIAKNTNNLEETIKYSLFSGGKRLRPLILLLTLHDLDYDYKKAIDVACSVELIHTYSLIHDDLPAMDNDELRRGKPTVHIAYGEANAILAGDALLTEAFFVLANSPLPDDIKVKLISLLAKSAGASGMVLGQVLDLAQQNINLSLINEIHRLKTGELFRFAFLAAAIIADNKGIFWDDLANNFSKAFQIADDIADMQKNEQTNIVQVVGYSKAQELLCIARMKCLAIIEEKIGKKELYKLVENSI